MSKTEQPAVSGRNEVTLIGRVGAAAQQRELPSGDQLVTLRVIVPRSGKRSPRAPSVDTIDIACFTAATRRRALALRDGDQVEVRGSLRRRFFRGVGVWPQSRYDVEADLLRRPRAQ